MTFQLTPIQQAEMSAMMALVPNSLLTIRKTRSGPWSDVAGWDQNRLPRQGDFVCLDGFQTDVDAVFNDPPTGICACGGGTVLNFLPDRPTGLSFVTLIGVTDATGVPLLQIGNQSVPIQPNASATLTIAPRGPITAAMMAYDTKDMSGGVMWTGQGRICGAQKTPYAAPSAGVKAGATVIPMVSVPADWFADPVNGDVLLFVGPLARINGVRTPLCETRRLVAMTPTSITVDSPLTYDHGYHKAYADYGAKGCGVLPNALGFGPVSNLSNNVVAKSAVVNDLTQRGHFMFMFAMDVQAQNMTLIDMGRTNALIPHTKPWKGNTIGRYAGIHIHCRNGDLNGVTTWNSPKATIKRCHVYGTTQPVPKHPHDNHGGYVEFIECTSHNGQGNPFTENGSEIGAFRKCLTSAFVGDVSGVVDTRISTGSEYNTGVPEDRAFQGNSIWLASGGVEATDCEGWGTANGPGAYCVPLSYDMSETEGSYFLLENATVPASAGMERPPMDVSKLIPLPTPDINGNQRIDPRAMAPYVSRCYSCGPDANSGFGIFTYNQVSPSNAEASPMSLQMHVDGGGFAWSDTYTANVVMHDFYFCGADPDTSPYPNSGYAVGGITTTINVEFENGMFEGYTLGPKIVNMTGDIVFNGVKFRDPNDVFISAPFHRGSVTFTNCEFLTYGLPLSKNYPKKTQIVLDNAIYARADEDLSGTTMPPYDSYFGFYEITATGAKFKPFNFTIDGQIIVYDCQNPDFIPFPAAGSGIPPVLVGMKNRDMVTQFGFQVGGYDMTNAWGTGYTPHPNITSGGGVIAAVGPACTGTIPPSKISAGPQAPVAMFSAMPVMGQVPLTVQFTDQSTNMPTSWMWDFGDGMTSTMQNPSHVYTTAGTYTVKLTATNAVGSNTVTKMNLIVAAVQMTMVPDLVTGLNNAETAAFTQAMSAGKSAGFSVALPPTHAYAQSPSAGTSAPVGSTITVQ